MPRKRYSDDQIAHALRAADEGVPVAEVCRKFGITETTFYRWRKRLSSMMPSEVERLSSSRRRTSA